MQQYSICVNLSPSTFGFSVFFRLLEVQTLEDWREIQSAGHRLGNKKQRVDHHFAQLW
nr:hypothetical protein Iba_chr10eCG8260 [Ipomoea batatas]